jgi:SlyX protein
MGDDRLERAEEELAHLRRAIDDLSDVVARQAREIERLDRRVGLLMERAAEAEAAAGGAAPMADQKPPHW